MSEEPRIQLKDSGTVVSELWREQSSGDTIIETESGKQLRLKDADGTLEADALDAGNAEIKNTLVKAHLGGSNQSITSGDFREVELNTVVKDELGEFDTGTFEFTPASTGWYQVDASVGVFSVSDQDGLAFELFDKSSTTQLLKDETGVSGNPETMQLGGLVELTGGNPHVLRFENDTTDCTIAQGIPKTYLSVRSANLS